MNITREEAERVADAIVSEYWGVQFTSEKLKSSVMKHLVQPVKLEWVARSVPDVLKSVTELVMWYGKENRYERYWIEIAKDGQFYVGRMGSNEAFDRFSTLADAKAAAQAHYEEAAR